MRNMQRRGTADFPNMLTICGLPAIWIGTLHSALRVCLDRVRPSVLSPLLLPPRLPPLPPACLPPRLPLLLPPRLPPLLPPRFPPLFLLLFRLPLLLLRFLIVLETI